MVCFTWCDEGYVVHITVKHRQAHDATALRGVAIVAGVPALRATACAVAFFFGYAHPRRLSSAGLRAATPPRGEGLNAPYARGASVAPCRLSSPRSAVRTAITPSAPRLGVPNQRFVWLAVPGAAFIRPCAPLRGYNACVSFVSGCSAPPSRVARRLAPVCARCRLPLLVALLPRSGPVLARLRSPPHPTPHFALAAPTPAPCSALSPPPVKQNALLGIIAFYQILIALFWSSDLFEA